MRMNAALGPRDEAMWVTLVLPCFQAGCGS